MFSVALLLLLAAGSCVKCETLTQPASLTVQPGQPLTITCQVSYSVDSYWTAWIRQPEGKGLEWIGSKVGSTSYYKDSLKNKFSISLDSSSKTVTLNGQNLQPEDSAVYYCARWDYYFDYWGKGTTVTVTSATSTAPSLFPLAQCGSGTGEMVTLGCLATGFTPASVTFAWGDANGAALTDFVQYPAVERNNLYTGVSQIHVRRADWDQRKHFTCNVTHAAGNRYISIEKGAPPICVLPTLKVFVSSNEEVENEKMASCFAIDFSPKNHEIKWLRNGEEINDKTSKIINTPSFESGKTDNGTTLFSAASYLKVDESALPDQDTSIFTCVFKQGDKNVTETVIYNPVHCPADPDDPIEKIEILPLSLEEMFVNKKAELVCQVVAKSGAIESVKWKDQQGNSILENKNKTKISADRRRFSIVADVTYEEWRKGIQYYCVVEHPELFQPKRVLFERKNVCECEVPFLTDNKCGDATETDNDSTDNTAPTFIILFLITLLYSIGTTAIKVK